LLLDNVQQKNGAVMSRQPPLIAKFDERIARQCGYILLDLLAARDTLADDLDQALWTENSSEVLSWFLHAQRRIMDRVPARCHQQFLSGVYARYFDDFVVRPPNKTTCLRAAPMLTRQRRPVHLLS
jgi:hypothetical protein